MTGPQYFLDDRAKLRKLAEKITKVPKEFSSSRKTVSTIKIQKMLENYI